MDFIIRDEVKIEWVELGEGWNGNYNPEDPDDEELLRFDVLVWRQGEWEILEDASYCTRFPVSATTQQREAGLELLMEHVYYKATSGVSIKKICEHLSWIGLDWIPEVV